MRAISVSLLLGITGCVTTPLDPGYAQWQQSLQTPATWRCEVQEVKTSEISGRVAVHCKDGTSHLLEAPAMLDATCLDAIDTGDTTMVYPCDRTWPWGWHEVLE